LADRIENHTRDGAVADRPLQVENFVRREWIGSGLCPLNGGVRPGMGSGTGVYLTNQLGGLALLKKLLFV